MPSSSPIGIFDSGVGGLSVLRHIRERLPSEEIIYVADRGYMPYGERSVEEVAARSIQIVEFLLTQSVKAIVVACNTATAAAVSILRENYALPIVGMEPGIKPAIAQSKSGHVGVLATEGTLLSEKFRALLDRYNDGCQIHVQACPDWVEHIEQGLSGQPSEPVVHRHLAPLLAKEVDSLVLGCTHYPFLREAIQQMAGDQVSVIETGQPVARQLYRRLDELDLLNDSGCSGTEQFWGSGSTTELQQLVAKLWGESPAINPLPEV
ncbi:MAG: glutamate racemase [Chromatiales bacterium]|nr:glutamate racemase [Chromatiales bacterium]